MAGRGGNPRKSSQLPACYAPYVRRSRSLLSALFASGLALGGWSAAACGDDPPSEERPSFDASVTPTADATSDSAPSDSGAAADAPEEASVLLPPPDGGLPAPELLATLPGLLDFDFEGPTLVYETAVAAGGVGKCTVPGCADAAPIPTLTPSGGPGVAVASGQVYFPVVGSGNAQLVRIALDGTARTVVATGNPLGTATLVSLFGGADGVSMMVRLPLFQGRYELRHMPAAPAVTRTDRVGRATKSHHANLDAWVNYKPQDAPSGVRAASFSGARSAGPFTAPLPPAEPDFIAVSPTIVDAVVLVKSPIAVYARAGAVYACAIPSAGNCGPWVATSVTGARAIAVDDEHLYVALATGIGRCSLASAAAGTCALSPVVVDGPIDPPIYLTDKDIVYRVGTKVWRARR